MNIVAAETESIPSPIITYLWSWALLEEKPNLQLLKNFQSFYGPEGSLSW
jgi:hypothetical protein